MVWEAWRRAAAAEATEQWRGVTTTELGQLCGIHANSVTKTGISQLTYTTGTCELTYLRTVEYLQHVHHANATWIRVTTRGQRRHNTKDAGNYWGRRNLDCTPSTPSHRNIAQKCKISRSVVPVISVFSFYIASVTSLFTSAIWMTDNKDSSCVTHKFKPSNSLCYINRRAMRKTLYL